MATTLSFTITAATIFILCTLSQATHPGLILTLVNNCPFTVYPAIQPSGGFPVLEKGGFPLNTLTHRSFPRPQPALVGSDLGPNRLHPRLRQVPLHHRRLQQPARMQRPRRRYSGDARAVQPPPRPRRLLLLRCVPC